MTTFERRFRLLTLLKEQPGIRVPDLARILDVSEGTIRNDLNALSESGQLTRVWGGAVPMATEERVSPAYTSRSRMNLSAKQVIARAAAGLVQDGDSILLDASTTIFHMAGFLSERRNLTVVTNGIEVGRELAQNPTNVVMLLGGILRPDGTAITRPSNEHFLKEMHIKTAFVSSSGFSLKEGLTEVDFHEAQFKRTMLASAGRVIALIDASKFGRVDLTPFAEISTISQVFVDRQLSHDWIARMDQAGLAYTLCGEVMPQTELEYKR